MYFLGFDIHINFYTGLIKSTSYIQTTIIFLSNFMALFCTTSFCFLTNGQMIMSSKIFKSPYKGVTSIAVPITVSVGILGLYLSSVFENAFEKLGFIFSTSKPFTQITIITFYSLIITIILSIMQEIFFRGIILTSLRRFGDGFSILASSLLFAIWYGGFTEFIYAFLISIPLCYFTIRSGSIYTAILSRITFEIVIFSYKLCISTLEHSLALLIILPILIFIIIFSSYKFYRFIKFDKAFYLKQPDDKMNAGVKMSIFSSSFVFFVFIIYKLIKIIQKTQIIG